ncbi:sugar kinase, ribokinase [Synechococcus sp. PCC 7502]|uniref:carbohydrate kinase family protein n=1 Tax=Synechococcus sp. PCC 7502 TaxID=1173263 RepID=UPI00029FF95F|nr:carbohydrate kinase [Synechococcus sp. PCC 7502]AFY72853.1 sugar kinase, ribokinase [Synechococcus sp. PCC 7502]
MAKVLCLGEILVDQIASPSSEKISKYYGGAPANVACGLAKLGTTSAFIGCIGTDQIGIELLEVLNNNGVDTSGVQIHPSAPTRQVYVQLDQNGDRHFKGFAAQTDNRLDDQKTVFADALLNAADLPVRLFEDAEFLVLGTLGLASAVTAKAVHRALDLAEDNFIKVIVDVNWRPIFWSNPDQAPKLINDLILRADFVKFSAEEAEWLYQTSNPRAIAQEFDHLEGVIVTNGDQSCRYYLGEYTGQVSAFKVEVVDATGAGDSFLAGFLHQICQINLDLLADPPISSEIIRYASAVGAITTMGMGAIAAQPNGLQVQNFLKERI